MKALLWSLAALLLQVPLLAQVKQLTGHLKGPGGKALPNASVSLKNLQDLIMLYAISDDKGGFVLSLPDTIQLSTLMLEVSHLGYKKLQMPLREGRNVYDLQLEQQAVLLPEVAVKKRAVITSKGDTLSYNVRSFMQDEDRSIGDVLRRLPGIEVGDDGKIYYNGKEVSNLYIHGDDLMGGRYGLATKVISKELILSVDVIKNHQPIKVLQQKTPTGDVAINLVLKNEHSMVLSGQAMIGGGLPQQYDAALNTILLNKRIKMINSIKVNNSGVDYQGDFAQLGAGGFGAASAGTKPSNLLSSATVSGPDLPRRNYYLNRSGVINLNNLVNNKQGIQFRSNVQGFIDRHTFDYSSRVEQYLAGDTIVYREQQHALRKPWLMNGSLMVMANKAHYFLRNTLDLQLNGDLHTSYLESNAQQFGQQLRTRQQAFSNDFCFKPLLNNQGMLDVRLFTSYAVNPQRLYIGAGLHNTLLNDSVPYTAALQDARVPGWYNELSLAYMFPKGLITQEYEVGFSSERQTLESALQLVQEDGSVTAYKGDAGNYLRWQRNNVQATAKYSLHKGRLDASLTVPVSWQAIRYRQADYLLDKRDRQFLLNPAGWVKFNLNVEDYLQLTYKYNNNMGNVAGVYRGAILSNYRSLRANDADLQEKWTSGTSLTYNFQRTIIMLFMNAGIAYTKTTVNSLYASVLTNNIQRSILLPYENDQSSLSASARISKYFFGLKSTVGVKSTLSQGRYTQFINEQLLPYDNHTVSLQSTIESKPFGKVGLRYNGNILWNNSRQRTVATAMEKTIVNRMYRIDQNMALVLTPFKMVFMNIAARHLYSRQAGEAGITYLFMDLNIRYKYKRWRTDFEFDCTNIANVNTYELYSVSSNLFSAARYTIRGRMAILRATFNL